MVKVNVEITGVDDLLNSLRSMKLDDQTRDAALTAGGEHLRSRMEAASPVGHTRKLKDSISKSEVSAEGEILIGPSQGGPDFRAHFPEFGTSKMKATPYIRPTYEREIGPARKIMINVVKERKGL